MQGAGLHNTGQHASSYELRAAGKVVAAPVRAVEPERGGPAQPLARRPRGVASQQQVMAVAAQVGRHESRAFVERRVQIEALSVSSES